MEKTKLTRFIEKYHLGGNVNAVVINSDNSKLSTRFITGDKSLLGELSCDNFTFENTESFVESLDDMIDDNVSVDSVGYSASELTNQVPLMFYFETEERDEVMNLLEKIRDDKELQTKSNAFLYLVRNYK